MKTEQIGEQRPRQKVFQRLSRSRGVAETRSETHRPRRAPAYAGRRMRNAVVIKLFRRLERSVAPRRGHAGIDSVQRGKMPVSPFRRIETRLPFVQTSFSFADLGEPFQRVRRFGFQRALRRRSRKSQRFSRDFEFERRTYADRDSLFVVNERRFGRGRGSHGQFPVLLDQVIEDKSRRILYQFDGAGSVCGRVQRMSVSFARHPRPAKRREHIRRIALDGRGVAPYVAVMITAKSLGAEIRARGHGAADGNLLARPEIRLQTRRHVASRRRPIVHFEIYVRRQVTAPGRTHFGVPLPLKIQRLRSATSRRQQVFSVIVHYPDNAARVAADTAP